MEITGQTALISGGASGMGAATAKLLAEQGAKVAILDNNIAAAQQIATTVDGLAIECDVRNARSVEQAIAQASDSIGVARICVCCAGIAPAQRIVGREGPMPLESFNDVIAINLLGTFNVMRVAAAAMLTLEPVGASGERGTIITTSSIAADEGQVGQAAYSASKGGVSAMTLPAAREFAQFAVRVNSIAPGLIKTPLLTAMPESVQEQLLEAVAFPKRFGRTEEFAELVAHIISNSYINGSIIRLDGALRMR